MDNDTSTGAMRHAIVAWQLIVRMRRFGVSGVALTPCRDSSRDLIGNLRGAGLIASGPRSPTPGAPYTYVTTKKFLLEFGLATLRDLPDFEALEDAGLLSKEKLLADSSGALGLFGAEPAAEEHDQA